MMMKTFYERFVADMFLTNPGGKPYQADEYVDNFGLAHAAMGLAGEAGEVVDLVKKHVFTGKHLDLEDLIMEMGDVEFYLEALRQQTGISREDVLLANWDKLSKRHADNETIKDYYNEKH